MKSVFILMTILCGNLLFGQTGEIKGKVTDEQGNSIPFATIIIIKDSLGLIPTGKGIKANKDGEYLLKGLRPNSYNLMAKYLGLTSSIKLQIKVFDQQTTTVNFILNKKESIKKVTVIAGKAKARLPKLIDVFQPKETTIGHSEIRSIRDVNSLAATSGGVTQEDIGNSLSVAGGRTNEVVYFVDGVKISGSASISPSQINQFVNSESYAKKPINIFKSAQYNPVSTFSIDVDKASYSNIRRLIMSKMDVPPDAVRIEEMINYFNYDYTTPKNNYPIAIHTEYAICPWDTQHNLLKIGLKAKEIEKKKRPSSNLVFLIDVSGSMSDYDKLPLLIQSMQILVEQLDEKDKVSIVVYAGAAGIVLEPTQGSEKLRIKAALENLRAGGSTAGGEGIHLAYTLAKKHFIKDGNNRIILATDGDFNVGISSEKELEDLIAEERKSGVFLTCLGFGEGNYKDSKMEVLADKGNGNYFYIDNISEARRCFERDLLGTILTVAKDVKIQIEFNPQYIAAYRLVGYENRMLENEDFKNDKIDAGDIGSGHTVTALYEIILQGANCGHIPKQDTLIYQSNIATNNSELATVKFRYKEVADSTSKEMIAKVHNSKPTNNPSEDFKFANAVAMFGLMLSNSPYKDKIQTSEIRNLISKDRLDADKKEFLELLSFYNKK